MGRHHPYKPRDYTVGQTLLTLRTRTKLTQAELATLVGVNRRSIQHWENGEAYPKEDGLQRLIAVFLAQGVFTSGQEQVEAAQLWEQISAAAPRHLALFNAAWFARLLEEHSSTPAPARAAPTPLAPANVQDKQRVVQQAVEVYRKRVDQFGVAEPMIQPAGGPNHHSVARLVRIKKGKRSNDDSESCVSGISNDPPG